MLFLDRLSVPGWVYGVFGTIGTIWLIVWITQQFTEEYTDIFKRKDV